MPGKIVLKCPPGSGQAAEITTRVLRGQRMDAEPWVGLHEAVRAVRAELTEAMTDGRREAMKFEVGPVELEFAVEIRAEGKADGQVRLFVVTAGAQGGGSSGAAHRVKVTLNPQDGDGPLKIGASAYRDPDE